jgi:hypothetical protein
VLRWLRPAGAGGTVPVAYKGLEYRLFWPYVRAGKRLFFVCFIRGIGEVRNNRQERGFEKYVTPVVVIVVMGMLAVILWQFVVA